MNSDARLPVWETIGYSFRFVWRHRNDMLRVAWVPFLMILAINLALGSFDSIGVADADFADSLKAMKRGLTRSLLQGVISVYVLVGWHRLVMVDYTGAPGEKVGRWPGLRDLLYFLQMLLLSLLFFVIWIVAFMIAEFILIFGYLIAQGPMAIARAEADSAAYGQDPAFVVLGFIAVFIGLLPAFYVALRLSLVLPETATEDRRGRMGKAWAASAGNGWRMVMATILVLMPVEAFNFAIAYLAGKNAGNALEFPLVFVASIGLVVMMAVLGTVLSRCYAFLRYGPGSVAGGGAAA